MCCCEVLLVLLCVLMRVHLYIAKTRMHAWNHSLHTRERVRAEIGESVQEIHTQVPTITLSFHTQVFPVDVKKALLAKPRRATHGATERTAPACAPPGATVCTDAYSASTTLSLAFAAYSTLRYVLTTAADSRSCACALPSRRPSAAREEARSPHRKCTSRRR